ncbi:UNVERIFIED_CONTAM: Organic cation/carnitine transporter 7 [Sesamum radiatum]|uniref:Organic cation/carnitine transporter 7 n=1 Tax=Sesamum radiatum TaxID=300843 RepID=A0AAW2R3N9_SESRA
MYDVFTELPGLILSAILVDKVGRRISLVLMYAFGFIFLLPLMFHQNEVLTTSLLFGARMCLIGTYTVAGIYCPELSNIHQDKRSRCCQRCGKNCRHDMSLRGRGVGCHQMAAISLFEAVMILSGTSVLLFKVETKGRQLNDIIAVHN